MPPSNLGQRWGLTAAGSAASKPKGKRKRGESVSAGQPKQRKKAKASLASAASAASAAPASAASYAAGLADETEAQHLKRHCAEDSHLRCARCKWLGIGVFLFQTLAAQLGCLLQKNASVSFRSDFPCMQCLTINELQGVPHKYSFRNWNSSK